MQSPQEGWSEKPVKHGSQRRRPETTTQSGDSRASTRRRAPSLTLRGGGRTFSRWAEVATRARRGVRAREDRVRRQSAARADARSVHAASHLRARAANTFRRLNARATPSPRGLPRLPPPASKQTAGWPDPETRSRILVARACGAARPDRFPCIRGCAFGEFERWLPWGKKGVPPAVCRSIEGTRGAGKMPALKFERSNNC